MQIAFGCTYGTRYNGDRGQIACPTTARLSPQTIGSLYLCCQQLTGLAHWSSNLPPKIRELISDLQRAGFVNRGGRGNHRNFVHPNVVKPITVSGNLGSDAKPYQVRAVRAAVEESKA